MPKKRDIPKEMEEGQNYTNHETGYTNVQGVIKYRPISLLNVGGKILEKALINRKKHYMYSTEILNKN